VVASLSEGGRLGSCRVPAVARVSAPVWEEMAARKECSPPSPQALGVLMDSGLQLVKNGRHLGRVLRSQCLDTKLSDAIIKAPGTAEAHKKKSGILIGPTFKYHRSAGNSLPSKP